MITLGMFKKKKKVQLSVTVSKLDQRHPPSPTSKTPCASPSLCLCSQPECPLPNVICVPMISTPFLQPGEVFSVFVVFLSLLTTTLKKGETGFMMPHLTEEETANQ